MDKHPELDDDGQAENGHHQEHQEPHEHGSEDHHADDELDQEDPYDSSKYSSSDGMSGNSPHDGKVGMGKIIGWAVAILLLFAGGAAFYFFSSTNSSRYILQQDGEMVVVRRGIFFPVGDKPYDEHAAFKPLPLPSGLEYSSKEFASRKEVERELYSLIGKLVADSVNERSTESLVRAKMYLSRARLLDVPDQELEQLMRVRNDLALAEAQNTLADVAVILRRALVQMESAAHVQATKFGDPKQWAQWTRERLVEFERIEQGLFPQEPLTDRLLMVPVEGEAIKDAMKKEVQPKVQAEAEAEAEAEEEVVEDGGAQEEAVAEPPSLSPAFKTAPPVEPDNVEGD